MEREGAPSGRRGGAKCGMRGCHLSHIQSTCQTKDLEHKGVPPLNIVGCHLKDVSPLQEGRTSQYAHV